MSSTGTTSPKPSTGSRLTIMAGVLFVLAIGFVGSPYAQSGPGGYGPGGYGPRGPGTYHGGERMGPPHGGGHRMLSRLAIEGPPSPAVMRDSINLSPDQLKQYARRYADHIAATRPTRDSLRTTMQAVRSAFERGDRSAAREQRDIVERQSKDLADRDKTFDKGLKDILSKDQQKRYQKWKENREKEERDRWRR
jgi:hypothetical protein